MEQQSDQSISNVNQTRPFSAISQRWMGMIRRLIEFFTFTEEDRRAAGIYLGNNRRDE